MIPKSDVLPRWRCEPRGAFDKNLVAVFVRAATAQAAVEMVKTMYGPTVTSSAIPDGY